MEKDLKELLSNKPVRSCVDIHLERPTSTSGTYMIDPNLGVSLDAVKGYCDFSGTAPKTCVQNSTDFSQISYLHMLHTRVSQSIQLPCSTEGPFRYVHALEKVCNLLIIIIGRISSITPCVYVFLVTEINRY